MISTTPLSSGAKCCAYYVAYFCAIFLCCLFVFCLFNFTPDLDQDLAQWQEWNNWSQCSDCKPGQPGLKVRARRCGCDFDQVLSCLLFESLSKVSIIWSVVCDKSPSTTKMIQYKHSTYDSMQAWKQSCKRANPCGPGCVVEVTDCDDEECTGSGVVKVNIARIANAVWVTIWLYSVLLNVIIQVSQFVSYSQLWH